MHPVAWQATSSPEAGDAQCSQSPCWPLCARGLPGALCAHQPGSPPCGPAQGVRRPQPKPPHSAPTSASGIRKWLPCKEVPSPRRTQITGGPSAGQDRKVLPRASAPGTAPRERCSHPSPTAGICHLLVPKQPRSCVPRPDPGVHLQVAELHHTARASLRAASPRPSERDSGWRLPAQRSGASSLHPTLLSTCASCRSRTPGPVCDHGGALCGWADHGRTRLAAKGHCWGLQSHRGREACRSDPWTLGSLRARLASEQRCGQGRRARAITKPAGFTLLSQRRLPKSLSQH